MLNKVRKQIIGNKEYSFKMTNRTIRKVDEAYGNYATVLFGIMEGVQYYTNALKLVSMCCVSKEKIVEDIKDSGEKIYKEYIKEWTIDELENKMTPEQYKEITELAADLYMDYIGINKDEDQEKENEKVDENGKEKN